MRKNWNMQSLANALRDHRLSYLHDIAVDADSLKNIKEFLKDKTTLVSGNSGVGKSTLINSLYPSLSPIQLKYHTITITEFTPPHFQKCTGWRMAVSL